jgi:hypothetical protein
MNNIGREIFCCRQEPNMQNGFIKRAITVLLFGITYINSALGDEQHPREYLCEATGYIEGYKEKIYQKNFMARHSDLQLAKKGVLSHCQSLAFECFIDRCLLEICTDDC